MSSTVTVIIPVLRGREEILQLTLQHLRKLKVSEWATTVVCSSHGSVPDHFKNSCHCIEAGDGMVVTWGDLFFEGLQHAQASGAELVFWLAPGAMPREGTLLKLKEMARCRKALIGPGKVVFPCRRRKSGGMKKSFIGLEMISSGQRKLRACDTVSEVCGCFPISAIQVPLDANASSPDFVSAEDFGLILSSNGTYCFADGECVVDVVQPQGCPELDSWLLSDRSVREIWKGFWDPACSINLMRNLRYHTRHWGVFGLIPAFTPVVRLAVISATRLLLPLSIIRRFYGKRSTAWQLQQLHGLKPTSNTNV